MGEHIEYRHIQDITDGKHPAMPALCGYVRPGGWDFDKLATMEDVLCPACVERGKLCNWDRGHGKHVKRTEWVRVNSWTKGHGAGE